MPDKRLDKLVEMVNPKSVVPTQLEFVDIAGLVKGASKGEGLGNQFLANIREVDAIVHVLRCFEDENITHVDTFTTLMAMVRSNLYVQPQFFLSYSCTAATLCQ